MTYQELRKFEVCTKCNKLAVEGKSYCFECNKKNNERSKNRRKNGLCLSCNNLAIEGQTRCFECRKRYNKQINKQNKKRKENGLCRNCGKLVVKGKTYCFECNKRQNERSVEYHKKRKENGLCRCGKLVVKGKTRCFECAFRGKTRIRIGQFCRKIGQNKPCSTNKLLGCDWQTLKNHIENQFQPGMSWNNQGEWHIDHIIPFAAIGNGDATLLQVCHYTNLQPLWARDNLSKSAKYNALTLVPSVT